MPPETHGHTSPPSRGALLCFLCHPPVFCSSLLFNSRRAAAPETEGQDASASCCRLWCLNCLWAVLASPNISTPGVSQPPCLLPGTSCHTHAGLGDMLPLCGTSQSSALHTQSSECLLQELGACPPLPLATPSCLCRLQPAPGCSSSPGWLLQLSSLLL